MGVLACVTPRQTLPRWEAETGSVLPQRVCGLSSLARGQTYGVEWNELRLLPETVMGWFRHALSSRLGEKTSQRLYWCPRTPEDVNDFYVSL